MGTEDLRAELREGGHELADEKTLAVGTTLGLARRAAMEGGVGVAAADTEARRLGMDHALRLGVRRGVVWGKEGRIQRQTAEAGRVEKRSQRER